MALAEHKGNGWLVSPVWLFLLQPHAGVCAPPWLVAAGMAGMLLVLASYPLSGNLLQDSQHPQTLLST